VLAGWREHLGTGDRGRRGRAGAGVRPNFTANPGAGRSLFRAA
jgi:hypothetical protein